MKQSRLTVLVDNRSVDGLASEHGYSLHLDTPEGAVLLDTGQQGVLVPNAAALGIDLSNVSALVLSHGHYDHTGGVTDMLRLNRNIEVYLHSSVFQPRYSLDGEKPTIVKMPLAAMEAVMHHPDEKIHWVTKPVSLYNSVGITGPISRKCEFEDTGGSFYLDPEGKEVDLIKDDIAIWLHTVKGLVICLGCCHAGLVNTLEHILARSDEKRIDTIIGGMHLLNADSNRLEKTVQKLRDYDIGRMIACHCSGDQAVKYLADNLDFEVVPGYAGLQLEV